MGYTRKSQLVIVITIVIITSSLLLSGCKPKTEINPTPSLDLKGKTIKELSQLNKPIECNVNGLLEKARTERKEGEGKVVETKIYILGTKIRSEGVSIWTDGKEQPNLNIYSGNELYSLLLDGSNKMMYLDVNIAGGIDDFSETIPPENLECKETTLDNSLFIPPNVCYSDKEPNCNLS